MTASVPLILMITTLTALLVQRFRTGRFGRTQLELKQDLTPEQVEAMLCDLRERREAKRLEILATGDVVELDEVYVMCKQGHRHRFRDYIRDRSGVLSGWRYLASLNVTKQDGMGIYTGHQPAEPGRQGAIGWVADCFGCPNCRDANFLFEIPKYNAYSTCGQHLLRTGMSACPMCHAMEEFAREELVLLANRERHHRKIELRPAV